MTRTREENATDLAFEESNYMDEIVVRSAPRWAWDTIDETLFMDSQARNFDSSLRDEIHAANQAMIQASERADDEPISREEIDVQD